MKTAFARLQSDIGMVINVEGLALGHIYNAGIAVRRLHITATAPGGHSWLHFGRPSAVHAIVELGAQITSIRPPQKPRTTFNIGVIDGGTTINTIATRASMWLDLRSDSTDALAELEQQVRAHIESLSGPEVSFSVEVVGDRPAGQIDPDHPLVQAAQCALELTGRRSTLETGSTDGNVSLAAGVPTVTVGVTQGGNAHRPDEYIEVEPVQSGLRQLILLTLAAASDPESPVIS
jgi:acetylornithine deacetylase/succinyl-diaminopimelate desuccinylase-like protein